MLACVCVCVATAGIEDGEEDPFMRDKSVQLPSSRRQGLQFPPPASAPKTEEDLARERKEQQNAEWNRRKRGVAQAKKEFDRAFMSDERRLKEEEKEAKQQAKEAEKEAKAREKGDAKRMAEEEKRSELLEAKLADAKAAAALQLAREAELRRTLLVEKYTPEGWQLSNKIDKILITFNHPLLPEGDDDLTHLVREHPINPQYDLFCYNNTAVCVCVCAAGVAACHHPGAAEGWGVAARRHQHARLPDRQSRGRPCLGQGHPVHRQCTYPPGR
jgi:hypothetical protein